MRKFSTLFIMLVAMLGAKACVQGMKGTRHQRTEVRR